MARATKRLTTRQRATADPPGTTERDRPPRTAVMVRDAPTVRLGSSRSTREAVIRLRASSPWRVRLEDAKARPSGPDRPSRAAGCPDRRRSRARRSPGRADEARSLAAAAVLDESGGRLDPGELGVEAWIRSSSSDDEVWPFTLGIEFGPASGRRTACRPATAKRIDEQEPDEDERCSSRPTVPGSVRRAGRRAAAHDGAGGGPRAGAARRWRPGGRGAGGDGGHQAAASSASFSHRAEASRFGPRVALDLLRRSSASRRRATAATRSPRNRAGAAGPGRGRRPLPRRVAEDGCLTIRSSPEWYARTAHLPRRRQEFESAWPECVFEDLELVVHLDADRLEGACAPGDHPCVGPRRGSRRASIVGQLGRRGPMGRAATIARAMRRGVALVAVATSGSRRAHAPGGAVDEVGRR